MLQAIISDVHSNLYALEEVLRDIAEQKADRIICLGDVVGYGPAPIECYNRVKSEASVILLGNHEQALQPGGGERFNVRAKAAINWTREMFSATDEGQQLLTQIGELPTKYERDKTVYVHGSPSDPVEEYLMPGDALLTMKMANQWFFVKELAFCGHTHLPGIFEEEQAYFLNSRDIQHGRFFLSPSVKAIVNVGSVGQPRDGNPEACYVLFDGDVVRFRRVKYDINKTIELFKKYDALHPSLAERLRAGR